jgi:protein subunit release factor A
VYHLQDVQKLASSLMDVGHRASQTADTVIAQSLPSKDGVQETAKEEIQQASNAAAKVASSVLPLANEPLGADATTPSSTPLEAKPGDGGREEGGVQGFFDKVFGKKQ